MQFEIEVPYTLSLIKRAAWHYTKQQSKVWLLIYIGLVVIVSICTQFRWWTIFNFLSIFILITGMNYLRIFKNSKKVLKKLETNPVIRFKFADDSIGCHSALGNTEVRWRAYEKLLKFSDIWLPFVNANSFYMLPPEVLTPEQQTFILDKLKENQVKIR